MARVKQPTLLLPVTAAVFGLIPLTPLAQATPRSTLELAHESTVPHPAPGESSGDPDHSTSEGAAADHSHGTMEISPDAPVPSVDLVIHPDAQQGWNLEVRATNFTFAPERVNQSGLSHEGHAHLFINGEKITRLYGSWYYLAPLPPGEYEVSVILSANTHEDLVHNGRVIRDVERLQVPLSP